MSSIDFFVNVFYFFRASDVIILNHRYMVEYTIFLRVAEAKTMNKLVLFIALYLVPASYVAAENQVINPIVPIGSAMEFGIWKVYNNGDSILFVGLKGRRILEVDAATGTFFHRVSFREEDTEGDDAQTFLLNSEGHTSEASTNDASYNQMLENAGSAQNLGQLQNARYQFGKMLYQVDGDNMIIFHIDDIDENNSGSVLPQIKIVKNDNSVLWTGTQIVSRFAPNFSASTSIAQSPPATGGLVPIQPGHTGSWFDPVSDGRGGFVNIADQGEQSVLVVAWFDYNNDGSQMWLVGNSAPLESEATSAIVPVQITQSDSGGNIQKTDWGTFTFEFTSCDSANLVITPNDGSSSQSLSLTRLTKITDMSC